MIEELQEHGNRPSDTGVRSTDVDILIGADYWSNFLTGRMITLKSGLVAVETLLGYKVGGRSRQSLAMSCISLPAATISLDVSKL